MFCPNCGAQLDDNALFCGSCGAKIAAKSQSAATSSTAAPIQPVVSGHPLVSFKIGNMDFSIVKENINFTGLICAIVAFISLFLPYLTVSYRNIVHDDNASISINFFKGTTTNAVFITIALLVYIAANVFGKKLFSRITSYVILVFLFIIILGMEKDSNTWANTLVIISDKATLYPGVGFYFECMSIVIMSVGGLIKNRLSKFIKNKSH